MEVLEAMACQEGFYVEGDRPQRNNNPLDLTWSTEARKFGATKGDRVSPGGLDGYAGMAVFSDALTGWRAAQAWLGVPARFDSNKELMAGYRGATLKQVIYRFAPPSENNTEAYLAFVCKATGLAETDVLTTEMLAIPQGVVTGYSPAGGGQ